VKRREIKIFGFFISLLFNLANLILVKNVSKGRSKSFKTMEWCQANFYLKKPLKSFFFQYFFLDLFYLYIFRLTIHLLNFQRPWQILAGITSGEHLKILFPSDIWVQAIIYTTQRFLRIWKKTLCFLFQ